MKTESAPRNNTLRLSFVTVTPAQTHQGVAALADVIAPERSTAIRPAGADTIKAAA